MVLVALVPCVSESVEADGAIVKLGAETTEKLCWICGAAEYDELPAWFASMVHVPATRKEAVSAETVQTVDVAEVKVTGRFEEAVAESVSGVPTVCVAGAAKVMV